jgi:hypothetical protein
MTRRFLIASFAVGLLALSGLNAQAGTIPLPSTLAALEGNSAIVGNLEFSNFSYTATPAGTPPAASGVTVNDLTPPVAGLTGLTFNAPFFAAAGTTVDYAISYTVTVLSGTPITDAYLSVTGGNFVGTGSVDVGETLTTTKGALITTLDASLGSPVASASFGPYTTINVTKDILINGGSNGATVSFVSQGFSTAIPEPASMALLGIGLSGLLTFRRFFKRTSVA